MAQEIQTSSEAFSNKIVELDSSLQARDVSDNLATAGNTLITEAEKLNGDERVKFITESGGTLNKSLKSKSDLFNVGRNNNAVDVITEVCVTDDVIKELNARISKLLNGTSSVIVTVTFKPPNLSLTSRNSLKDFYVYVTHKKTAEIKDAIVESVKERNRVCSKLLVGSSSRITTAETFKNSVESVIEKTINNLSGERPGNTKDLVRAIKFQIRAESVIADMRTEGIAKKSIVSGYISLISDLVDERNLTRQEAQRMYSEATLVLMNMDPFKETNSEVNAENVYYKVLLVNFTKRALTRFSSQVYDDSSTPENEADKKAFEEDIIRAFNLEQNTAHSYISQFYELNNAEKGSEERGVSVSNKSQAEYDRIVVLLNMNFPAWFVRDSLDNGIDLWAEMNNLDIKEIRRQVEVDVQSRLLLPDVVLDPIASLKKSESETLQISPEIGANVETVEGFEQYANSLLERFNYGEKRQTFEQVSHTVGFFIQHCFNPNAEIREIAKVNLAVLAESFNARIRSLGIKGVFELIKTDDGREYLGKIASEMADYLMFAKFGSIFVKDQKHPERVDRSKKQNIGKFLSNIKIDLDKIDSKVRGIGSQGIVSEIRTSYDPNDSRRFYRESFINGTNRTPRMVLTDSTEPLNNSIGNKLRFLLAVENVERRRLDINGFELGRPLELDLYNPLRDQASDITYESMEASIEMGNNNDAVREADVPLSLELAEQDEKSPEYDKLKRYAETFYKINISFAPFMEKLALFASTKNRGTEAFRRTGEINEGRNRTANYGYASLVGLFYKVVSNNMLTQVTEFLNKSVEIGKDTNTYNIDAYTNFVRFLQTSAVTYNGGEGQRNFQVNDNGSEVRRPYLLAEILALKALFASENGLGDKKAFIWNFKDPFQRYTRYHTVNTEKTRLLERFDWYLQFMGYNPVSEKKPDASLVGLVINRNVTGGRKTLTDFPLTLIANMPTNIGADSPVPPTIFAMMSVPTNPGTDTGMADKYPSAYDPKSPINALTNDQALDLYAEYTVNNSNFEHQSNDFFKYYAQIGDIAEDGHSISTENEKTQLFPAWNQVRKLRQMVIDFFDSGRPFRRDPLNSNPPQFTSFKRVTSSLYESIGLDRKMASKILNQLTKEEGMKTIEAVYNSVLLFVGSKIKELENRKDMFLMPITEALTNRNFMKIYGKDYDGNPVKYWEEELNPQKDKLAFKGPLRMQEYVMGVTTEQYDHVMYSLPDVDMATADKDLYGNKIKLRPTDEKETEIVPRVFQKLNEVLSNKETRGVLGALLRFRTYFGVSIDYFPVETGQSEDSYIGIDGDTTDVVYLKGLEALFQHMRTTVRSERVEEVDHMINALTVLEDNGITVRIDNSNSNLPPVIVVNNPLLNLNKPPENERGYNLRDYLRENGFRIDPWNGMQIINSLVDILAARSSEMEIRLKTLGNQQVNAFQAEQNEITIAIAGVYEIIKDINVDLAQIPVPGTNMDYNYLYPSEYSFSERFGNGSQITFTDLTRDLFVLSLFADSIISLTEANVLTDSTPAFFKMFKRRLPANQFNLFYTDHTDPRVDPDFRDAKQYGMLNYLRSCIASEDGTIPRVPIYEENSMRMKEVELSSETLQEFAQSVAHNPELYADKFPRLIIRNPDTNELYFDMPLLHIDAIAMCVSGICLPKEKELDNIYPIASIWSGEKIDLSTTFFGEELTEYSNMRREPNRRVPAEVGWIILCKRFEDIKKKSLGGYYAKFCSEKTGLSERGLFNLQTTVNGANINRVIEELEIEFEHSNFIQLGTKAVGGRLSSTAKAVENIGGIVKIGETIFRGALDTLDDFIPASIVGLRATSWGLAVTVPLYIAENVITHAINPLNYLIPSPVRAGLMALACRATGVPWKGTLVMSALQLVPFGFAETFSITNPLMLSFLAGNWVEKWLTDKAKTQDEHYKVLGIHIWELPIIRRTKFRERVARATIDDQTKRDLGYTGSVKNGKFFDPITVSEMTGANFRSKDLGSIFRRYLAARGNEKETKEVKANLLLYLVNALHYDAVFQNIEGVKAPKSLDDVKFAGSSGVSGGDHDEK